MAKRKEVMGLVMEKLDGLTYVMCLLKHVNFACDVTDCWQQFLDQQNQVVVRAIDFHCRFDKDEISTAEFGQCG